MKIDNKKIVPLKNFGQNYLQDKNILRKITEVIDPQQNDQFVEIGPGLGALTEFLYDKVENLCCVEIDKRISELLIKKFPRINLIVSDFLQIDLDELQKDKTKKIRVAGNIPYNITSPIIFKLLEKRAIVKDAVFLVQLEVAQRITAKKGTKDYGILAVILNTFGDTELCFKVSPNVFFPKPKVFSAVIKISFKEIVTDLIDEKIFIKIVKAAFSTRRKTLKNSLRNGIFAEFDFSNCGVDLSLRAEQLDLAEFITLANYYHKNKK
ncbi:MAG: ribosomal RNA small subunit methyltransferase A [Chlorobiaceae bacterium]|nr:ribosomal RNA small subunit methyltransferase A [Chlorobiaceae bacterium]MBA4309228.1 ribosomal RNA small subunit methyltransferase A [Chlorobiaceae bacterium]